MKICLGRLTKGDDPSTRAALRAKKRVRGYTTSYLNNVNYKQIRSQKKYR